MKYYEGFDHTNTTDDEEEVAEITSTEEEPKTIKRLVITHVTTNVGVLHAYVEKERVIDGITLESSPLNENPYVFDVDTELPIGQSFKPMLTNKTAGANAGVKGYIEYEIRA